MAAPAAATAVSFLEKIRNRDGCASNSCVALTNGYKIPNIVHLTFKNTNVGLNICQTIRDNMNVCKLCEFRFYTDEDVLVYLSKNFPREVLTAYLSISDQYGAMKSDFFRYCVLFKTGGIYIDVKSSIRVSPFRFIRKTDTCILDVPRTDQEPWRSFRPNLGTHEQWLLFFAPTHPILQQMIDQMTSTIRNKIIPRIPGQEHRQSNTKSLILHITGPDAFSRAVRRSGCKAYRLIKYVDIASLVGPHARNYVSSMYGRNGLTHYSNGKKNAFYVDGVVRLLKLQTLVPDKSLSAPPVEKPLHEKNDARNLLDLD